MRFQLSEMSTPARVAAGIVLFGMLAVLLGLAVQILWNQVLAPALTVSTLTFWQALGLFVLAKLFFGFGGGSSTARSSAPAVSESGRVEPTGMPDDARFQDFWQTEGRAQWEAYLARQGSSKDGDNDQL